MLLFWDIDGTLLTTGRAGIFAWQEALQEIAGVEVDLWDFDTAGHPDLGIAQRLLTEHGGRGEPSAAAVQHLVTRYEELLPAALHRRVGHVLPNVREILVLLAGQPDACSLLLTGNTRAGAWAKLTHYGLAEFFSDGAFSDGYMDRTAIARAAWEQASASGYVAHPGQVFVVGDTPHDVRCGKAIGARTIGVATGQYEPNALALAGAWRVFNALPPAHEFRAVLDGGMVPADG